jgi:transposase
VDTQRLLLKVVIHPADVSDREGAKQVLAKITTTYPRLERIWADMGYQGALVDWVRTELRRVLEVVRRPTRREWVRADPPVAAPAQPTGFTVLPRRWVVERTFAWIGRNRRLSKDDEALPATEEAWIQLAMSRVLLNQLAGRSCGTSRWPAAAR